MRKAKRLWIKQEKRIVKLLYRKGLIRPDIKIKDLYWQEYHSTNKRYRSKNKKYKFTEYMPEIFFGTCDYWGEWDDHSIVYDVLDGLYWKHTIPSDTNNGDYPKSTFKYNGRQWFINYLNTLPTVNFDNKINKLLKVNRIDF